MIILMIYCLALLPLCIISFWLALLTLGSWLYKAKKDPSAPLLRLVVIIPAHNEELQIGKVIEEIRSCDYPEELLQIIVIADNCTDNTALLARQGGVESLERFDLCHPGKGQALEWFLQTHQELYEQEDALVFVDADVLIDQNMLKELSASLAHPAVEVVQGFNGVSNPYYNWRTALTAAAYNVFNHVRMAGNNYFFNTATLKGLGMAFEVKILQESGWPAHSVVEDMEFSILLLEKHITVQYNPAAIITSEAAAVRKQADAQRRRWEGGRFRLLLDFLPRLSREFFNGNWKMGVMIMDLFIPPISLLLLLVFLCFIPSLLVYHEVIPLFGCIFIILFFYIISGQIQRGAPLRSWGYLLAAPLFIAWKLLIYISMLCRQQPAAWKRTIRRDELINKDEMENGKDKINNNPEDNSL